MNVQLRDRQKAHVKLFWDRTQDKEIKALIPMNEMTLENSLELFNESLEPHSTSYGKVFYCDDKYIGDVWCYGIDEADEKMAMISILIFNKDYWQKGISQIVLRKFLDEIKIKYEIYRVGAFTYSHNIGSIKMLEKFGFARVETFVEDGHESYFYDYHL